MMSAPRPFKIWNHDRSVKKSVTAGSLEELTAKGKEKLKLAETEELRVVLEEDGTEIDEEDYFTFLAHNTTLMLLQSGDKWRPEGSEDRGIDEPDYMHADSGEASERVKQLISGLQKDISRIITFSNEDLSEITEMKLEDLSDLLQDTNMYAKSVQESCQRHLDERKQTSEAMDLLRLYHKARQCSPYVGEDSDAKRQKMSNT